MSLSDMLKKLKRQGHCPAVVLSGKQWSARVDSAGNYWAEDRTPKRAMKKAVNLWTKVGCPVEGN